MIYILPLTLCCGIIQAGLQGRDNPGQKQSVMHLGSLLSQTAATMGQGSGVPKQSYTCICTHMKGSLSFCHGLTSLACPGLCCGLGVLSFPCAMCKLNPTFLCSLFLQQRFGTGTCFAPLTSAHLISFSAFPLPRGRSGGMIVDPLRSGFPQPGTDPSSGIPGRLPPGAVPPGARFDPFGPLGAGRSR